MDFFTADTHFGHKNIIKYANRPFANVDEMDNIIIDNINSKVGVNDVLWHLGDFTFRYERLHQYRNRIKCRNVMLIFGNHDKDLKKHIGETSRLFSWVGDYRKIKNNNQDIILFHYAMRVWDKAHYGSWHLYGHSHGSLPDDPNARAIDIGVDCHNYYPLSFDEVRTIMDKKNFVPIDHHIGRNNAISR